MKKLVALSLTAISLAFVAVLCGSESAFADDILKPIWDQTYSTTFDDLKITNTVKGADVLLDKTKVHFYNACVGGEAGFNNNQYGIKFNGEMANYFYCQLHKHSEGKKWRLWRESDETTSGDYYTVATYSTVFGADGPKDIGPISGSIEILSKGAVTDAKTGDVYDLYFKITNVRMKSADCTGDSHPDTMMAILMGMGTQEIGGANNPPVGTSMFTARAFQDHWKCDAGALYDVEVRVRDPNTKQFLNKSMLWAFNDVDIADIISDSPDYHTYDSAHPYAEHVTFKNGLLTGSNGYNISMVEASDSNHYRELYPYTDNLNSSTVYHRFYEPGNKNHVFYSDGSVNDNSASFLVRVSTGGDGFKFEWGGSTCGSYIDDAPASRYRGRTTLKYNNVDITGSNLCTANSASSGINYTCTINGGTSKYISFAHSLGPISLANGNTADLVGEPFYVQYNHNGGSGERPGIGQNSTVTLMPFGFTTASTHNVGTVSLTPGQKKTYTESLHYRYSTINDNRNSFATTGPHTVTVQRPAAKFNAELKRSVKDGLADATISNNKVKITSSDGSYTVTFTNTIGREQDGAGDTVGTPWESYMTKAGSTPSGYSHSGTANRTEGQKTSDGLRTYQYSGNLRYGESITFCSYLKYTKIIDATNTDTTDTKSSCVTVERGNAICELDPNFSYGINKAVNTGRIGVLNSTLSNTTASTSATYTKPNINNPSQAIDAVAIYARPNDQIKFYYNMCAGSLYPIKERGLSTNVWYRASGESSKSGGTGNKYLFRNSVPMVGSTYNNPRTWNSNSATSGFLSSSSAEHINSKWESPNSGAGTGYRCGSTVNSGWYQVAGKQDCTRSGEYNIGVIDAGSTFSQKLEWNDQSFNNGTITGSDRSATASVIVPYNYVLKPYMTNNSGNSGKVAYLGETLTMTPGIITAPRTNDAFPSGKQNYATITKLTDINVKYYYKTSSGAVVSETTVPNSSRSQIRLNTNGLISGTVATESQTSVDSGGTQLPSVSIQIPNSGVNIGDKICVEISAYPADSHDLKDAAIVSGKGVNDIALDELSHSSDWVTAVSCSTIAKKPTMSVESSNAYSATEFKTAQYARNINNKMFNFGSWSEYGVFGKVRSGATLFASGAALGYSRDGYATSRAANISRSNDAASADNKKVSTKSNSDECTFMTQTFANANCTSSTTSVGGVMADQYERRIKERYATKTGTFDISGLAKVSLGGVDYVNVSGYNGADIIVSPSGILRFDSKNNLYISSLPNISNAQYAAKGIEKPNRTIVYSAPDKSIVIDGDINYDNGNKSTLDDLTQVIIIAKNVYFTSRPTYVNAIIIAETVNTCKYNSGSKVAIAGKNSAATISYAMCNQALRFDSPVITKKIILNRTAGADQGDDAIRRAEIFNLNMANFLWSFNQMSRLSQATTTYSRELPTRY